MVGVTGSIPVVLTIQSFRTRGHFPSSSDRPFVPEFAVSLPAPFGLCGRLLSLLVIWAAPSPHPKIPFLARVDDGGHAAFAVPAGNLGEVGVLKVCAIVVGSEL
jgi:hypothetical protein